MENRKGVIGTTVGILGTLTTTGIGIGLTLHKAAQSAANCQPAADFIKTFVMSNLTIPAFNTTIIIQGFNIPITVGNSSIPISEALGQYAVEMAKKAPDVLISACYNETILHGAAYTAIAATVAGLLTLAYQRNHTLQIKLENLMSFIKPENEESIPLKMV